MRKYVYLPLIIILGILVASCSDTTTNPPPVTETGSIFINSSPVGAQISVDGTSTGKVTPDSVTDLATGDHSIGLSLAGYRDTSITVTVHANLQTTPPTVTLVSTLSTTDYGPVIIFESADPRPNDPSGLDLFERQYHSNIERR